MIINERGYVINTDTGVILGRRGKPLNAITRGYAVVSHGSERVNVMAHRFVWEAVYGPIPNGMQINHKNGIKHDNRISNLELVTASENMKHAYANGLACAKGERNGRSIGKRRIKEAAVS